MQWKQCLVGPWLLAVAMAQSTVVSPVGTATVDGSTSNTFPFLNATPRRYQQLHGDLGSGAKLITQLSFRLSSGTSSNFGTRLVDLELWFGQGGPALRPSFAFDANYVGGAAGRTLVLPRTVVTFGPQGNAVTGVNPFTGNMDLVLTTPYLFPGTGNSLVWEAVVHSTSPGAAGLFSAPDAEQGVVTTAVTTPLGGGCTASGQSAPMAHTYTVFDVAGTLVLNTQVTNAPPNALCFLALGVQNPNFFGLCGPILTDAQLVTFVGFSDAVGAITADRSAFATAALPNGIQGLDLYTQVFAFDAAVPGQPLVLSNGRRTTTPSSNLTRVNQVSRILNTAGGTTAGEGAFLQTTVGYGLVTRFTYF
jgi:hypothetical protein